MKKYFILFMVLIHVSVYSQKKTIVTINNEKILVEDFKKVYEKNLGAIDNEESKSIIYNLNLFINYKLKVYQAYDLKLDTLPSYKKEIETYRNQLSAPYLQDKNFTEKLIREAYFRTKNEIKVKHILIRTKKESTPEENLVAYNKILKIRDRIIVGEDFEQLAMETSEDSSARYNLKRKVEGNRGNLGYFSAFKMLYAFEDAAYNSEIGEVSMPFKTKYGYHILKVDSLRISKGEIEVSHILITDTSAIGKAKIDNVYIKLNNKESFKSLAKEYSNDTSSKNRGGKLNKFGMGRMVASFEKAAFSLKIKDDYSQPFRTRYGWHIVKLIKSHPVKSYKEMKSGILSSLKRSGRMKLSDDVVLDKLRKNYTITENDKSKVIFKRKDIRSIPEDSLQNVLFTINNKEIKQLAFVLFLQKRRKGVTVNQYQAYKNKEILKYFKENLINTEPEYANLLNEYEDGLLLFELMQKKIWNKSSKDTLGLKQFFVKNKSNYKFDNLNKFKGLVINDYQSYLEKIWISDLRSKNKIKVNKKELKKLIKFYKNK